MDKNKEVMEETTLMVGETEVAEAEVESLIITFKKPYKFEGKEYTVLDLTALEDLSAADLVAVNKHMDRTSPGVRIMPEVSLEYALILTAKALKMPIEFFEGLPPREALKVKNRVMGFLFGSE